ncbi:unnamed protein product [Trifolium pratense]|uniref:Uncharacterized protein n=1 Tax=Trifolium pratense TaxID=57577 RepID=A0ACB0JTZ3_TRIPR|nr:unnamed protein product [Trifolium pratense]
MGDNLWVGANHISKKITEENKSNGLRLRTHNFEPAPPSLIPMLEDAGKIHDMPFETTGEERLQYFRIYLLMFIGCFLMPDSTGSRVSVKYLPLLSDPNTVSKYSWGSACLATLYRGLCVAADTSTKAKKTNSISGCGFLLQAWARFRIKCFSRIRILDVGDGPYALEVLSRGTKYGGNPAHDVVSMRSRLDEMTRDDFIWRPYQDIALNAIEEDTHCWSATTYLICFEILEYHQTDRVKLQFGIKQTRLRPAENMSKYHKQTRRGGAKDRWDVEYESFIDDWNNRHTKVITGTHANKLPNSYFEWYYNTFNPFFFKPPPTLNNPSTSTREFTPDPDQTPMQTTTQNQSAPYLDYTPPQFPIYDHQTYISPPTTNFYDQQNFYPSNDPNFHTPAQQNFYTPAQQNFPNNLFTSPQHNTYDTQNSVGSSWINELITLDDPNNPNIFDNLSGVPFTSLFNDTSTSNFFNASSSSNPTASFQYQQDDVEQHQGELRRGDRVRHAPTCGTGGHLGDDDVGGGGGRGRGRARGRDN